MIFGGMQKVSLLDYPGVVSCTLFTSGCNFRCPFCHNSPLVLQQETESYTEDDVLRYLKKRKGLLEGVTISGGEPLLHSELEFFLEKVKALDYKIKLDTNGSNPDALRKLIGRGLIDRVAMDIKNSPALYGRTAGLPDFDLTPIQESRSFLINGDVKYEFRTTVVRGLHTEESLASAAEWIAGAKEYYLQGFVDQGMVLQPLGLSPFTEEEMTGFLQVVKQYVPNAALRGL